MSYPIRNGFLGQSTALTRSLNSMREAVAVAEEQAVSGLKALHPSDLPVQIGEAHDMRAFVADQALYQANGQGAMSLLLAADDALGGAHSIVTRAWEITVSASSEVIDDGTRDLYAIEMEDLFEQLVGYGNSRFGDRYLFAGEAFTGEAFDDTGAYVGAAAPTHAVVGQGESAVTGWDGAQLFQGGTDVYQLLNDVQTALAAQDTDGLSNLLDDLQTGLENMQVVYTERLDELVSVDPVQAYAELEYLRTTYEQALQVAGTSLSTSLFDFIR